MGLMFRGRVVLVGLGVLVGIILSVASLWLLQRCTVDDAEVSQTRSPVRVMEEMTRVLAAVINEETADRATPKIAKLALETRAVMEMVRVRSKKLTIQELETLRDETSSDWAKSTVSSYVDERMRVEHLLRGKDHPLVAELDELKRWMGEYSLKASQRQK